MLTMGDGGPRVRLGLGKGTTRETTMRQQLAPRTEVPGAASISGLLSL